LGAVDVLVNYELRRVLAKKRILVLVAAVFLTEAGLYLVISRLPPSLLGPVSPYVWVLGVLAPTLGLLQVTSLMVGSTVFSDEYEAGTSDFWLTRPVSRTEYYIGKALGGLALILCIVSAYIAFSVGIAWFVFGPQNRLDLLLTSFPASVASALPFYAIGLAFSEVLRRGMMATILSGLTFFGSYIFESYANAVATFSNDRALLELTQFLPTWGSVRITTDVLVQGLSGSGLSPTGILALLTGLSGGSSTSLMLLNVIAYTAIALLVAWLRLRTGDVSRRAL
jgi:ABC-type transport system involved in multi-copper enzyme maturation, permease component